MPSDMPSVKSIFDYQKLRQTGLVTSSDDYDTQQRFRFQANVTKDWFRIEYADELQLELQRSLPATTMQLTDSTEVHTNQGMWTAGVTIGATRSLPSACTAG